MNMDLQNVKRTIIPQSAKVELDAAEFYQLVSELDALKAMLSISTESLEVEIRKTSSRPDVYLTYTTVQHTKEFVQAVVSKICEDPFGVKILYVQGEHYLGKNSSWLSSFDGFDLLDYPEFDAQWNVLDQQDYTLEMLKEELAALEAIEEEKAQEVE